jgi:ribosomal protein L22
MAGREGGKVGPGDVGTKQDQPSEQAAAPDAKVAQEAAEAKAEQAAVEAPEEPKEPKAPSGSPAEGTAAAETGVDKAAAAVAKDATADEAADDEAEAAADEPEAEAAVETPPAAAPRARRSEERTNGAAPVVRAQAKYVRTSARKARLVCDHIRGKSVDEARAILAYTPRAVAKDWAKLLNSAVANAEHNHELLGEDLRIEAAYADEGPTLKRFQPRAMGRATRIRKRTSHLTITLTPKG